MKQVTSLNLLILKLFIEFYLNIGLLNFCKSEFFNEFQLSSVRTPLKLMF